MMMRMMTVYEEAGMEDEEERFLVDTYGRHENER